MPIVRVSQLNEYNKCPYKSRYDTSDAPLIHTFKGDILNVAATSTGALEPFLQYYWDKFGIDEETIERYHKIVEDGSRYVRNLRREHQAFYQEAKHLYLYPTEEVDQDKQYWVTGTPDIIYLQKDGLWMVEDLKFSTHARYGSKKRLAKDAQRHIYPLMVMNMQGVDECGFKFTVFDKKKGTMRHKGEHVITRDEAEQFTHDLMGRYIESVESQSFEPTENQGCFICSAKSHCPLFNTFNF